MIRQMERAALAIGLGLGLGLGVGGAAPALAQDRIGLITIVNDGSEERRVCVYKNKAINLISERCFDIPAGREAIWARGENRKNERFAVKVFKKRKGILPPKYLYSRSDLEGDTVLIRIRNNSGFGYSRYRPPARKKATYRVKFCNKGQPGKVWLAVAASNRVAAMSQGYWSIAKGECTTINYSHALMRVGGGFPDEAPLVMYRAFTTGENARRWEGTRDNEDPLICINRNKKFLRNLVERLPDGERKPRDCEGEDFTERRFKYGPTLSLDVQIGQVNF
ncbi:MAG: hypothetical protein AAF687_06115 [Pseudomonadota bacterium]